MNKFTARIAGNFLVAFCTTSLPVFAVTKMEWVALVTGLSAGIIQGLLAAGKELVTYGSTEPKTKKGKLVNSLSFF